MNDLSWQDGAACKGRDTNLFYEQFPLPGLLRSLRVLCAGCVVFAECREYSMKNETYGFWAGTTEKEREKLTGRSRRRRLVLTNEGERASEVTAIPVVVTSK